MSVKALVNRVARIIALMALGLVYIAVEVSPAAAQSFSVAFGNKEFIVSPGDSFTGSISLMSMTDEQVSIRIYVGDWVRVPGQTSKYGWDVEGGNEPRSFLGWMTFTPERMTLEPEETRDINYEVNIPDDPTLEGSYWGVIFIEAIPSEEPEIPVEVEEGIAIGIRTIFRYAIHVFATIEGTETREATFTSLNLEPAEGGFDAVAVFENTGNIYMKPIVWLEMTDIAGEVVYEQEHREITVLPESARAYVFELRNLPIESGEYVVMIYADYGAATLIAAQGRVNLAIEPPAPEEEEPVEAEEPAETDTPTP